MSGKWGGAGVGAVCGARARRVVVLRAHVPLRARGARCCGGARLAWGLVACTCMLFRGGTMGACDGKQPTEGGCLGSATREAWAHSSAHGSHARRMCVLFETWGHDGMAGVERASTLRGPHSCLGLTRQSACSEGHDGVAAWCFLASPPTAAAVHTRGRRFTRTERRACCFGTHPRRAPLPPISPGRQQAACTHLLPSGCLLCVRCPLPARRRQILPGRLQLLPKVRRQQLCVGNGGARGEGRRAKLHHPRL